MKIIIAVVVVAGILFFIQRSMSGRSSAAAEENIKIGADFLAKNKSAEDVKTTESGLQYKVLRIGTGTAHPKASDKVNVHYHGTLINGTVFDSSVDRGTPISFGLSQVVKGWTEGVQLMVVGEKTRFFIPSHLAYGNKSMGAIKAGSTLIFDVELLGIN